MATAHCVLPAASRGGVGCRCRSARRRGDGGAHRRLRRIGEIVAASTASESLGTVESVLVGVGRGLRRLGGAIGGASAAMRVLMSPPQVGSTSARLFIARSRSNSHVHDVAADHRRVEVADGVGHCVRARPRRRSGDCRRGEADEQSVVAQLEGQLPVLEHARAPFRHGDAADLGGARLRRDGERPGSAAAPRRRCRPGSPRPYIASRTIARCSEASGSAGASRWTCARASSAATRDPTRAAPP